MPETMSPREKVARTIFDHAPHRFMRIGEVYPIADAILAALASSGDHAELLKRLTATGPARAGCPPFNPDGQEAADAIRALIAENAALRGKLDWMTRDRSAVITERDRADEMMQSADQRATEAERKLAEAVEHLKAMSHVAPRSFEVEAALAFLSSKEAERG